MRRYLFISSSGHLFLLTAWVISSTLLSKPRMSYYAVDLFSSLPAGGSTGGAAAEVEAPKAPPAPPAVEERKLPAKEVIRVKGKTKKFVPPQAKKKHNLNLKAALAAIGEGSAERNAEGRAGITGSGGSGIVADAGPAFPYPWYLKAIADRLNHQWRPPQEYQTDTLCQVAFVIHRDGQVSDSSVEKPSGDSVFDQLAMHAVLYSNPLPSLPGGFPDDTLRVHMKFVGKPL